MSEDAIKVLLHGLSFSFRSTFYGFINGILETDNCTLVLSILKMQICNVVVADSCRLIITKITRLIHFAGGSKVYDRQYIFTIWSVKKDVLREMLILYQVSEDAV